MYNCFGKASSTRSVPGDARMKSNEETIQPFLKMDSCREEQLIPNKDSDDQFHGFEEITEKELQKVKDIIAMKYNIVEMITDEETIQPFLNIDSCKETQLIPKIDSDDQFHGFEEITEKELQKVKGIIAMKYNIIKKITDEETIQPFLKIDSCREKLLIPNIGRFSRQDEGMGIRSCPEIKKVMKIIPTNFKLVQCLYAQLLIRAYKIWTDKGDVTRKLKMIKKLIKNTLKNEEYPRGFQYIDFNMYGRLKVPRKIKYEMFCACSPTCVEQKCYRKSVEPSYKTLTAFYYEGKGWGVKTLAPLCKGEFIVELCGKVWHKEDCEYLDKAYLVHFGKYMIDCKDYSNLGRLVNHSCLPNSELRKFFLNGADHVGLFSLRKIKIFEEITFSYAKDLNFFCCCGEDNCISNKISRFQVSHSLSPKYIIVNLIV